MTYLDAQSTSAHYARTWSWSPVILTSNLRKPTTLPAADAGADGAAA